MTLNGAQQQTPGEGNQLQDPKGGEGDAQEPKVDHKPEADNRRLLSIQHSIVYVESQKILHHPTQDAKMHNKKGKRHKVVCPAR